MLRVWDEDTFSKDDKIGHYALKISDENIPMKRFVFLEGNGPCGAIFLEIETIPAPVKYDVYWTG